MSALARQIAQRFMLMRPAEAARVLDGMRDEDVAEAIAPIDARSGADLLQRMGADTAARALAVLPVEAAVPILVAAEPVRVAGWLALQDEAQRDALIAGLPERSARSVRDAVEYPPGTAGQLMDTRAFTFDESTPVSEVIERLRNVRKIRVLEVLVCDAEQRLTGNVPLQALLAADPNAAIATLAAPDPACVLAMASRDQVVELLGQRALASLPVVDLDRRILGILRFDALLRAAQQAATDDLQQMVGAGKEERALSHPWFTVKNRLPWLCINLLTAFSAAAVVGQFDATIAQFTVLAVLLPVVAGQSGNTGAQALAVTMRGLALREIRVAHAFRVLAKEVTAALANGATIAFVTASAVWVWSRSPGLATVIGCSMIVSMVFAATAGAMIPILLTALKRDPATASSILLTTITDITGMSSSLGLATLMKAWL
jgi:magnesium transporter